MRTAGAEVGQARQLDARFGERGFVLIDEFDAPANFFHRARMQIQALDPLRDHARDHGRRQLRVRRQEPVAVWPYPFALLVELADHARAHIVAPVVKLFLQLILDDLPLFFDDEDFRKSFGKMPDTFRLERPRHRHLEHADADLGGVGFGDAEIVERLPHIEVALAARDDAEPGLRRIDDDAVQFVDAAIMQCGVRLVILHPRFCR